MDIINKAEFTQNVNASLEVMKARIFSGRKINKKLCNLLKNNGKVHHRWNSSTDGLVEYKGEFYRLGVMVYMWYDCYKEEYSESFDFNQNEDLLIKLVASKYFDKPLVDIIYEQVVNIIEQNNAVAVRGKLEIKLQGLVPNGILPYHDAMDSSSWLSIDYFKETDVAVMEEREKEKLFFKIN